MIANRATCLTPTLEVVLNQINVRVMIIAMSVTMIPPCHLKLASQRIVPFPSREFSTTEYLKTSVLQNDFEIKN